ncbi:hypothetical protein AGABI2DRAFT_118404 [Agaricus bisporus var. bisporus H97]|uniref:hypothetical protein n=1 Tax=Agaricus bisporus var. bisporus (strain H97 / ATCC MYA-4626 / FGSC 10389) TaxID=936046 RepID=UPI00029F6FF1|nr:hypothetical protein AGABI2DRAFT_118404 [Agaricus bisporus var. bisporus H97]EKV46198.1 hypothetical protein AGABI2DRAFT_118404 [Agaricus bisporus var. bisporus H97]
MLTPSSITWGDFFDTLDGITALYMIVVIVDPGILAVRNSDRGPIESRYSHHDLAFSSPQILRFAYPREIARTLNVRKQVKMLLGPSLSTTYISLSTAPRSTFGRSFSDCPYGVKSI